MTLPAPNTLARLRRAQLVELCTAREIEIEEDDKKADLIATLMNWVSSLQSHPSTGILVIRRSSNCLVPCLGSTIPRSLLNRET